MDRLTGGERTIVSWMCEPIILTLMIGGRSLVCHLIICKLYCLSSSRVSEYPPKALMAVSWVVRNIQLHLPTSRLRFLFRRLILKEWSKPALHSCLGDSVM